MIRFLNPYHILVLHKRIIDETGGVHGLRDAGLLEASIHRPKASFGGEEFYPTIFEKAAALLHSLAMNHVFIDGNKRTAFVAADVFLKMNGYKTRLTNRAVEYFMVKVVVKKLEIRKIAAFLRKFARQTPRPF